MTIANAPLMEVEKLSKTFETRRWHWGSRTTQQVHAVREATFTLHQGETIGIVGESGSGKTTLARMLLHLAKPSSGRILFKGTDTSVLDEEGVRTVLRPSIRMVFQDPDATLNPAYSVGVGLHRALLLHDTTLLDPMRRVEESLGSLGLDASFVRKYPDELSGGEKRRIGICRALLTRPDVVVADEPLSGLDVLLQEMVLGLLVREQRRRGFGLILVSHDLDRVNQVCDRVLVMHSGHIVEDMRIRRNGSQPNEAYQHPYSRMLRSVRVETTSATARTGSWAVRSAQSGDKPTSSIACPVLAQCTLRPLIGSPSRCTDERPALLARDPSNPDHLVACHFVADAGEAWRSTP